jgi:hypothetical protein
VEVGSQQVSVVRVQSADHLVRLRVCERSLSLRKTQVTLFDRVGTIQGSQALNIRLE